jgi:phage protein D
VFLIERGKNLLSYAPTIKVVDQYSEVRVRGRDRDRENTDPIDETASASDVQDELHDEGASPGPDVREHFFPGRPNPQVLSNQTNLDPDRGRFLAQVTLRRQARGLFVVEVKTIGIPRLRPGAHVEVRGLRPPFDGFFYVTRTVHSFGADGYTTTFTARRPGMLLPPYAEA